MRCGTKGHSLDPLERSVREAAERTRTLQWLWGGPHCQVGGAVNPSPKAECNRPQSSANIERTKKGSEFGLGWVLAAGGRQTPGPSLCSWATFLSCVSAWVMPSVEWLLGLSESHFPSRSALHAPTPASPPRSHQVGQRGFLLPLPLSLHLCVRSWAEKWDEQRYQTEPEPDHLPHISPAAKGRLCNGSEHQFYYMKM